MLGRRTESARICEIDRTIIVFHRTSSAIRVDSSAFLSTRFSNAVLADGRVTKRWLE
jgi:hypothetical protein